MKLFRTTPRLGRFRELFFTRDISFSVTPCFIPGTRVCRAVQIRMRTANPAYVVELTRKDIEEIKQVADAINVLP